MWETQSIKAFIGQTLEYIYFSLRVVLLNKKGEGEVLEFFSGVMHHIVLDCSHPPPSPTHPCLGSVIVKTLSAGQKL